MKDGFQIIVTCQGEPSYYYCKSLAGALLGYAYLYLKYKKYGTMTFKLEEIVITDSIWEKGLSKWKTR